MARADLFWLGYLLELVGVKDRAVRVYTQAVELDETAWLGANKLAALITESGPARAVEYGDLGAEQVPDKMDEQGILGWAQFGPSELRVARAIYDWIAARDDGKVTYPTVGAGL